MRRSVSSAAEALAYLNDTSGVEALGDTAIHQQGFSGLCAGGPGGHGPARLASEAAEN